jgi:hypothetical protein
LQLDSAQYAETRIIVTVKVHSVGRELKKALGRLNAGAIKE